MKKGRHRGSWKANDGGGEVVQQVEVGGSGGEKSGG